jgi:PAS domain S-box-containing protein
MDVGSDGAATGAGSASEVDHPGSGAGVSGVGAGSEGSMLLTAPWCPIWASVDAHRRRSAHTRSVSATVPPESSPVEARSDAQRRQLQRVADALAWSLEPRAVAAQLLDAACSALGAASGWVAVRSEDETEAIMLASQGFEAETLQPWTRVSMSVEVPMTVVMRTGRAIAHASADERHREFPALERYGTGAPSAEASVVVPMAFEGSTIGALAVSFGEAREVDAADRWFLQALAAYGAGALERARLVEAVRQRDGRLKLALETSGTWIWTWDVEANTVQWTPEPPAFAGPVGDAATPDAWVDTVHPDDRGLVREALEACLAGAGPYEVEFRVGRPGDAPLWLLGTGSLLAGEADRSPTVIGTTRDITERKVAELEHLGRIAAEREAARLRDAFIGVVSHELRTPITTIFGGTRVLSRRWREMPPAERDALLADVSGEADRLFRMVEDLLVLTRVERGSLDVGDEPVALRPAVERVLTSERARSPEVTFETVIPPDLPSVQGEEMYVEQVLRNLLTNAAKYGGAGSRVTVDASVDGDAVVLRVIDEGPGIEASEVERIFELFYRSPSTAPTVAGAGIGLYVCRQLAIAMGGSMRARNRPGGGACFELMLRQYADDELG